MRCSRPLPLPSERTIPRHAFARPLPSALRAPVRCLAIFTPAKFDPAAVRSFKEADKPSVERALAEFHARLKSAESQRAVVWEVCELISACARHKMIAEAEAVFDAASARGGDIQRMEWVLHRAWCTAGEVSKAENMISKRRRPLGFKEVHGMLLLYARIGDIEKLDAWMERGQKLGLMTLAQYNVVLSGYASSDPPLLDRVKKVLDVMKAEKIKPDDGSFGMLIGNCAQRKDLENLDKVLALAQKEGVALNTKLYTAAMNAYITEGDTVDYFKRLPLFKKARELFDQMQKHGCTPNDVTYNTIIRACTTAAEAEEIWEHMSANSIQPSARFFNVMLSLLAQRGLLARLVYFTEMMRDSGIRPTLHTFVNLVVGLCNAKMPFEAMSYWEEMQKLGFNHRDPRVLRALYVAFGAAHKFEQAKFFSQMWQSLYGAVPPTLPSILLQDAQKDSRKEGSSAKADMKTRAEAKPSPPPQTPSDDRQQRMPRRRMQTQPPLPPK